MKFETILSPEKQLLVNDYIRYLNEIDSVEGMVMVGGVKRLPFPWHSGFMTHKIYKKYMKQHNIQNQKIRIERKMSYLEKRLEKLKDDEVVDEKEMKGHDLSGDPVVCITNVQILNIKTEIEELEEKIKKQNEIIRSFTREKELFMIKSVVDTHLHPEQTNKDRFESETKKIDDVTQRINSIIAKESSRSGVELLKVETIIEKYYLNENKMRHLIKNLTNLVKGSSTEQSFQDMINNKGRVAAIENLFVTYQKIVEHLLYKENEMSG